MTYKIQCNFKIDTTQFGGDPRKVESFIREVLLSYEGTEYRTTCHPYVSAEKVEEPEDN